MVPAAQLGCGSEFSPWRVVLINPVLPARETTEVGITQREPFWSYIVFPVILKTAIYYLPGFGEGTSNGFAD